MGESLYIQGVDGCVPGDGATLWPPPQRPLPFQPLQSSYPDGSVLYTEAMLSGEAPLPPKCVGCRQQQQFQWEHGGSVDRYVMNGSSSSSSSSSSWSRGGVLGSDQTESDSDSGSGSYEEFKQNLRRFLPGSAPPSSPAQTSSQQRWMEGLLPSLSLPSSFPSLLPFLTRRAPPLASPPPNVTASPPPHSSVPVSATSSGVDNGQAGTVCNGGDGRSGEATVEQEQQRPPKPLSLQQQCLKGLVSTVVPFDSVNFKNAKSLSSSTRKGLEVRGWCPVLVWIVVCDEW